MKYATRLGLVLAVSMAAPGVSYADATTYLVGGGNGKATFVSDAPLETMTGKTNKVTGTLTVDPTDITTTTGKFKAPVKSLRTGNDLRDEHLQGDGWLDAKKNPFIHFDITEVVLGKKGNKELKQGKDTKVQVNGKLRSRFQISTDSDEETIKERALADERILKFIDGKAIKKVIVVQNKLVNIVV